MAYLNDPGTLLSNAIFGPEAFNDYYAMYGLGGLMGYGEDKGGPFYDPFGQEVQGSEGVTYEDRSGFTGKGLEYFGDKAPEMMTNKGFEVLKKVEGGGYLVLSKTGDKTGSVYLVAPQEDGTFKSMGVVANDVPVDTNNPWWKGALPIMAVAAAPLMAYGAQALMYGTEAANAMLAGGMAFPTGVADEFAMAGIASGAGGTAAAVNPLYDLSVGNSLLGPGTKATVGLAVPESMAGSALIPESLMGPGSTLAATGGTAGFNLNGVNSFADPFSLGSLPTQTQTNFGIPPGGYPGAGIPPGGGIDPITGNPTGPTPDSFPPGGGPPTGTDTNLPKPPVGTPPGGSTTTSTTGGTDPAMLLAVLADMYNKYAMGNNIRDTMSEWANKVFGKSGEFENLLMKSYTDPRSYYGGDEALTLRDIVSGRENRTASNLGRLTNPTIPDYVTTKAMLENMNQYRTGLTNSANVGRAASGEAMRGMGEALKGQGQAASWYTPATFNAGNSGTNLTNTVNSTVGTLKNFWDWGNDFYNWWNKP